MKKFFLTLAVVVMTLFATAQTNQYFWYQGNLMMGNPIAQIDSVTFGENEPTDTLHILLPRTIIKEVHDTVEIAVHDTLYITNYTCLPEGALPGEFSVSPTKKVRFSKGNLQYNAALGTHQCADGTTQQGTWRFAEHQWDYVGDATQGTVYENGVKCDNALISSSYNGWIDLFGWGTSGWNSGAIAYQPWATSINDKDYYPGNSTTNNLQDNYANADWGVYNAIENGGDEAGLWRTMTGEEWNYLLSARTNANQLCGQATIDGLHVLILLPDNWTMPNSLTFTAPPSDWTENQYTLEQWKALEQCGAVCIPSAKRRIYGNTIDGGGNIGIWTASYLPENPVNCAWQIVVYGTSIDANNTGGRHNGHSVRLVQDVE